MWSHYGGQHHGLCIGYSAPPDIRDNLNKVRYGGSRLVEASAVAAMLAGSPDARDKVDAAVLLRKAGNWRYEREWRLIGQSGLVDSPLVLEEIIFGMRCLPSVKHTVVKALEGRIKPVKFYEIRETRGTFRLRRHPLGSRELRVSYPRDNRSICEAFEVLPAT